MRMFELVEPPNWSFVMSDRRNTADTVAFVPENTAVLFLSPTA